MENKKLCTGPRKALKHVRGLFSTRHSSKTYTGLEFVCPDPSPGGRGSGDMCWLAAEGAVCDLSKISALCTLPKSHVKKKSKSIIPGNCIFYM